MKNHRHLPKGFYYLSGESVENKNEVLSLFIKSSLNLFTELVEFPPVAFSEMFKKGANITGEKIYEFKDRSNRDLVLTPDSQAHLYNYHLSRINIALNARYSWISPTFRYRNVPVRHFYQIGYASINHLPENEITELFICTKQLVEFIRKIIKVPLHIKIVNPGLIVELLSSIFKDGPETISTYDKLRLYNADEIPGLISDLIPESKFKADLLHLTSQKTNDSLLVEILEKYKEGQKAIYFSKLVSTLKDVTWEYNLNDLYSSEILNGVGFVLFTGDKKIGDGGIYNVYGNRFDGKIETSISVCTGINIICKFIPVKSIEKTISIFIREYESIIPDVLILETALSSLDFRTQIYPVNKKNKIHGSQSEWQLYIEKAGNELFSGKISNHIKGFSLPFTEYTSGDLISIITNKQRTS